jgi:histidine triad (HIT) family protein
VLVIPTEHRETIVDLEPREASAVMASVVDASRAINQAERIAGISIWQNNGTDANQAIPHVHFHVAGTLAGGGTEWGPVAEASISETEAIAEKLRKHLGNSLSSRSVSG